VGIQIILFKNRMIGPQFNGISTFKISKISVDIDSVYSIVLAINDSGSLPVWLDDGGYVTHDTIISDTLNFTWINGFGNSYSKDYRGRFLSVENHTGGYFDTAVSGVFDGGYYYSDIYLDTFGTIKMFQGGWSIHNPGGFSYVLISMNGNKFDSSSVGMPRLQNRLQPDKRKMELAIINSRLGIQIGANNILGKRIK
jgi:hypothetical protein